MRPSRRGLLTGASALLATGCGAAGEALADAQAAGAFGTLPDGRSSLWLRRPDGSEIVSPFRTPGGYNKLQMLALSWFLRDKVDHDHAVWMEPRLFDLLAGVQTGLSAAMGRRVPLVVTSGYRTAAHNAAIETAARNSMHLYGFATDLKAPGFNPRAIGLAASFFRGGGIGLYDDFTHLDVWKVRTWTGPRQQPQVIAAAPG